MKRQSKMASGDGFYTMLIGLLYFMPVLGQNPPRTVTYKIVEEQEANTYIGNVLQDARINQKYDKYVISKLKFSILTQPNLDKDYFKINENSGILRVAQQLDRDKICPHKSDCTVSFDVAIEPVDYFQLVKVQIIIADLNDNEPSFAEKEVTFDILESAPAGSKFVIEPAEDQDSGQYSVQRYTLFSESTFELQTRNIQSDSGGTVSLVLVGELDREFIDKYEMTIVAYDGGEPAKTGQLNVVVNVLDVNDHNPEFDQASYEIEVSEDTNEGETIIKVVARDPDSGPYGRVNYRFNHRTLSTEGDKFDIDHDSGDIYLKEKLDYEGARSHTLTVIARDQGQDSLPAQTNIIVRVLDVNDHAPEVTLSFLGGGKTAQISENAKPGIFVAHISVTDIDAGINGEFSCSLEHGLFYLQELSETTYQILTAGHFDREVQDEHILGFQCTDRGYPQQQSTTDIHVKVIDENDHVPMFSHSSYTFKVKENSPTGTRVGAVNATDGDIGLNGAIRYNLTGNDRQLFNIDPKHGIITTKAILDHEYKYRIPLTVIARDQGTPSNSSTAIITVLVEDINDEKPQFTQPKYTFGVIENQPRGASVGQVAATDADKPPFNNITFSVVSNDPQASASFTIDRHTGRLWTLKPLDREKQAMFLLKVIGSNPGQHGLSTSASVSIYVSDQNDNPPEFIYPTAENNTIQISNKVPKGYIVASMKAKDRDIGNNGRVFYYIKNGTESHCPFSINPATGTLTLRSSVSHLTDRKFHIKIEAKDHGLPANIVLTDYIVIVNSSLKYTPVGSQPSYHLFLSQKNLTIVVAVAGVSGFLILLLIIAIVVVMFRKQDPHTVKYMAPLVVSGVPSRKQEDIIRGDIGGFSYMTHGKPKKEVSFVLQPDGPGIALDPMWQEIQQVRLYFFW